jgi:hypothetical protein
MREIMTEARIALDVAVSGARISTAPIRWLRPHAPLRRLLGMPITEAPRAVARLFSVCGMAHEVALTRAIEQATGAPAPAPREALRDLAVLAEAAAAHVWHLALTWPTASGGEIDARAVRESRALAARLSTTSPEPVEATATVLARLLRDHAMRPGSLPEAVLAQGAAGFGALARRPSGVPALDVVGARLASDASFAMRPHASAPVDASALPRRLHAPEVEAAAVRFGYALLARLLARRAEALVVADALEARAWETPTRTGAHEPRLADVASGTGFGSATTARGPLHYWVRTLDRTIDDVRAVSPTDWTFAPDGIVAEALVGAPVGPTLARDVGWLMTALDPCVPWTVEVHHA